MFIRTLSILILSVVSFISASNPTTTMISPNSNAVVQVSTSHNSNYVVGLQTGSVVYWSAILNATNPNATVMADTGNAVVTFKKGIFVHILDNAGDFPTYIFLDGQIIDSQTNYDMTGMVLGEF